MGLWLAAPCAAHGRAEPLGPRSHTGSLLCLFPMNKGNSNALPLELGLACLALNLSCLHPLSPPPSPQPCTGQSGTIWLLPGVRRAHALLGCSRQARQKGRVQTSCGWSLQPPPALALAFLQADVDARHHEVVCALVRINKVPARHPASQGCLRPPNSLRHAKASAR